MYDDVCIATCVPGERVYNVHLFGLIFGIFLFIFLPPIEK